MYVRTTHFAGARCFDEVAGWQVCGPAFTTRPQYRSRVDTVAIACMTGSSAVAEKPRDALFYLEMSFCVKTYINCPVTYHFINAHTALINYYTCESLGDRHYDGSERLIRLHINFFYWIKSSMTYMLHVLEIWRQLVSVDRAYAFCY